MPSIDFVKDIQKKDRKTFFSDFEDFKNSRGELRKRDIVQFVQFEDFKKNQNIDFDDDSNGLPANSRPLIADFTEYSPLHNGHFHCMKTAKSEIPEGLFVAVVPGLFERDEYISFN